MVYFTEPWAKCCLGNSRCTFSFVRRGGGVGSDGGMEEEEEEEEGDGETKDLKRLHWEGSCIFK